MKSTTFEKTKYILALLLLVVSISLAKTQTLIPYRAGNLWGYANTAGQIVVTPQYQAAGRFATSSSITWVKKGQQYACINSNGELITDFKFDEVEYRGSSIKVREGFGWYCLNAKAEKVSCASGGCGTQGGGLLPHFWTYREAGKLRLYFFKQLVDEQGNKQRLRDTLATAWDDVKQSDKAYAAVKKDSLWGFINREGRLIIPYVYSEVEVDRYTQNFRCFKVKLGDKYGLLNAEAEEICAPKYPQLSLFIHHKLAKVYLDEHYWAYMDKNGRLYSSRQE